MLIVCVPGEIKHYVVKVVRLVILFACAVKKKVVVGNFWAWARTPTP